MALIPSQWKMLTDMKDPPIICIAYCISYNYTFYINKTYAVLTTICHIKHTTGYSVYIYSSNISLILFDMRFYVSQFLYNVLHVIDFIFCSMHSM